MLTGPVGRAVVAPLRNDPVTAGPAGGGAGVHVSPITWDYV